MGGRTGHRERENMGRQQEACTVKIFTCSLCKRCLRRKAFMRVSCTDRWTDLLSVCVCLCVRKYEGVCSGAQAAWLYPQG